MYIQYYTGPGAEVFTVGAGCQKGQDGTQEKLYCQVYNGNYNTLSHGWWNVVHYTCMDCCGHMPPFSADV